MKGRERKGEVGVGGMGRMVRGEVEKLKAQGAEQQIRAGLLWGMMTNEKAAAFAGAWYGAWNRHDVEGIMALYAEGIEHSSPFIARYAVDAGGAGAKSIVGKKAVGDYFARALVRNPTLRFDPMFVTVGLESVILVYRRMSGDLAAEVFVFDEIGKVKRSISHYGISTPGQA